MEFGVVQADRFNAIGGSYSLVTDRELYDSQVTATDAEALLLKAYFQTRGEEIYKGNVSSNRVAAAKKFRLYPSGKTISLNLVYPKPSKPELRLYLSSRAGFMPKKGDVWFLFVSKQNELWIGAMPEAEWRSENSVYRNAEPLLSMDTDVAAAVEDSMGTESKARRKVRSRELVEKRLRLSKYKCEFDHSHRLFIARATGCPYLEVHHVIPLMYQSHFKKQNLDSLDNLCCLCPDCHAAVHHADEEYTREILAKLSERRSISLHYKLSNEELFRLYSVEDIVR